MIVPSATLPDGIVMNEIMYPAEEIEKSFKGLERTPAPLGHPTINGMFVSARDPEGINLGWIGAWNENVRRENGRVFLDKVIDVEMANRSEGGKRVLNAIDKGEPVHTSTGLYALMEAANGDVNYKNIAREIEFDHDAILLDEQGAATPSQGVGMMVNSKGETTEIEVINSALSQADQELDWAVDSLARALDRRNKASVLDRMKAMLLEMFGTEREPSTNEKEDDMPVTDEQFKSLSDEVKTLSEALKPEALATVIGNAVTTAVKPITDNITELQNAQKAKDEAEKAALVEKVVKANLLTEAVAKELTLNALKELAPKAETKGAAPLSNRFNGGTEKPAHKAPEGE